MTDETKIIEETGSVPSKACNAHVVAAVYDRRKCPTLTERRYKTLLEQHFHPSARAI